MYNLTDNQKDFLRWIVQQVRDGNLSEEFIVVWEMGVGSILGISTKATDAPKVTEGILDNLKENRLILCKPKFSTFNQPSFLGVGPAQLETSRHCTITGKAYEAVDSDFSAPDISFIEYLTPLSDISDLDEEIKNRCLPILGAGSANPKLWDSAVRAAGVILEERLREIGGIVDNNRVGQNLVNDVFGNAGTLISKFSVDSERQGYRDLYAGIFGTFRNPNSHHFVDPSPEDGGVVLVFINLLLKMLEDLR